ncbi:MAG: hypothetical protein ACRENE_24230 [Polyangiaceae bacterium]
MKVEWLAAGAGALLGLTWILSCASVPSDGRIGIDAPSSSDDQFHTVSDFLDHRCGSLDCHGTVGRNFRVWGCEGMRLEAKDIPGCSRGTGGSPTTADEREATYRSLVGLEPAVMSEVVDHHGDPAQLTFIRKQRGAEAHKGGKLVIPGDLQDRCVTSWLGGNTDVSACLAATDTMTGFPMFPALDASTE